MFSMNRLSTAKRAAILGMLVEGNSLRATTRMAGCSINTVSKLLLDIGEACAGYQDEHLRDLACKTVEADEIWSFVYSKQRNVPDELQGQFGVGDVWTWTALDADSKLIVSWYVGARQQEDADAFMVDLASRLRDRIQLTTMAYAPTRVRYSPAVCTGTRARVDRGDPDPARISTSYVERQNLTMRMGMRRFTRLTNGFSKKLDNHMAAIALHFMHYNFARTHKTLERTPAMAAGIADHRWSLTEIAGLLD
jgi:IS1 family transposase